jgi:dTDP-4-amino-4,6-dideoxygalactose transaminase
MVSIPLVDLRAQYRSIKAEIDQAIQRVLDSGRFVLGPEVERLEQEAAAYCRAARAAGVASGTDALLLSLRALGIGPGDEVVTAAFSFFATAGAIVAAGATPVFADIDPQTYTLDPAAARAALTPRTKAILPVHLYGHPCDMEPLLELARERGLKVLEDCAQAIGAEDRGRRVGSFGHAGALSFYPTKNLGGCGEGGMVVTNDPAVAEQVRLLRAHGSRQRYHHELLGTNSRLDELQAAILRVKLRHLEQWNDERRSHAQRYAEAFRRQAAGGLGLPQEREGARHVYHLYCIRAPHRDRIQQALARQGIESQVAYPSILPAQPALQPYLRRPVPLPNAEAASREVLALPIYPELTPEAIGRIVKIVTEVAG